MNKNLIFFLLLILFSIVIMEISCKKKDISYSNYIIRIDSVIHDDTINKGDNLTIKFYGVIGNNGCYEFNKFDVSYTGDSINVITWGIFRDQQLCTEILPSLYGKELIVSGLQSGISIINIIQPDTSSIISEVFVK